MFILEQRASTIIYNFICSNPCKKKYILPANICPIIPAVFLKAKQRFEFVDISPLTLALDENQVEEKIKSDPNAYAAILYVHPYGNVATPTPFFQRLKEIQPSINIIDDRCLCYPEFETPDMAWIDLILFSTGYAKPVDIGFGGFGWINQQCNYQKNQLTYSVDSLCKLELQLKQSILEKSPFTYHVDDWLDGSDLNVSLSEFQKRIQIEINKSRRIQEELNCFYHDNLPGHIQLPSEFQNWRLNIRTEKKDVILNHIFSSGLFASSHYASLGGIMGEGFFPAASNLQNTIINLFNDRYYTLEKAFQTASIINQYMK